MNKKWKKEKIKKKNEKNKKNEVLARVMVWMEAWVTRPECPKGVKDEVKQPRRAAS